MFSFHSYSHSRVTASCTSHSYTPWTPHSQCQHCKTSLYSWNRNKRLVTAERIPFTYINFKFIFTHFSEPRQWKLFLHSPTVPRCLKPSFTSSSSPPTWLTSSSAASRLASCEESTVRGVSLTVIRGCSLKSSKPSAGLSVGWADGLLNRLVKRRPNILKCSKLKHTKYTRLFRLPILTFTCCCQGKEKKPDFHIAGRLDIRIRGWQFGFGHRKGLGLCLCLISLYLGFTR